MLWLSRGRYCKVKSGRWTRFPEATARKSCLLRSPCLSRGPIRFAGAGIWVSGAIKRAKVHERTVSVSALEGGRVEVQTVPHLHSGRQTLATARTAGSENLATAFGGEACAEAVATLADKLAGLIGAFHGTYSCFVRGLDGSMRQARQHRWGFDLVFPTKTSRGNRNCCSLKGRFHWLMAGL